MPGLPKLGPAGLDQLGLETLDNYCIKSKSSLTEALRSARDVHHGDPPNLRRLALDCSIGSCERGSHESENDLGAMVRDFMENGSAGQEGSCCSSDSDSGATGITKLADRIKALKTSVTLFERDLLSLIHVLILSINEIDLHCKREVICKGSCIQKLLVKHLRVSGYNAAVCKSKWKSADKVPGGEYEYVDLILEGDDGATNRLIIDIDFQSHFEIARPIPCYAAIFKSLPVVYVGSLETLEQILQVMVEAAKFSLKQNSMPLPPWRTIGYLSAKWLSPYERELADNQSKLQRASLSPEWSNAPALLKSKQKLCSEQWRRLKASLLSEVEPGRVLKPVIVERNRGLLRDRRLLTFNSLSGGEF